MEYTTLHIHTPKVSQGYGVKDNHSSVEREDMQGRTDSGFESSRGFDIGILCRRLRA